MAEVCPIVEQIPDEDITELEEIINAVFDKSQKGNEMAAPVNETRAFVMHESRRKEGL